MRIAISNVTWRLALCMLLCFVLGEYVLAQEKENEVRSSLRNGGDFRLRQETMDNIESPSKVIDDNYLRMRTRLWMEYDPVEHVTLRIRALNEFRHWFAPDQDGVSESANYEWPDELVFDNIYIDLHGLLEGSFSLRIGRQDFMVDGTDKPLYGKGRVIYDGTGEDGSRSRYFNAVRATWKPTGKTSLDAFGIYMPPKDDLAVDSVDRDLTGYTSADDDITETGAGLYLKNNSVATCPFETYTLYKHDDDWTQAAKKNSSGEWIQPKLAWQTLDASAKVIENPALDLYTVGIYFAPKFCRSARGSFEGACQFGERGDLDISAFMVDAVLTQDIPIFESLKPAVEAEFYYLSGDDPSTTRDEGWEPVWARYTQHSDLLCRTFSRCRWTNLTMPMFFLSATVIQNIRTSLGISYVTAPEDDGLGSGKDRGWWYSAKLDYDAAQDCLCSGDKLTFRIILEILDSGNYYLTDETAFFGQWQIIYKF